MTVYFMFYDNSGKDITVPVSFKSERVGMNFVRKYQNFGGIRQFNYDYYGDNIEGFKQRYYDKSSGKKFLIIRANNGLKLLRILMKEFTETKGKEKDGYECYACGSIYEGAYDAEQCEKDCS